MEIKRIVVIIVALIGSLILVSQSRAQERLKKIRITYPTESIAVLPLFAAYRWKTFEDIDGRPLKTTTCRRKLFRLDHRSPMRRWRAARSGISPESAPRR